MDKAERDRLNDLDKAAKNLKQATKRNAEKDIFARLVAALPTPPAPGGAGLWFGNVAAAAHAHIINQAMMIEDLQRSVIQATARADANEEQLERYMFGSKGVTAVDQRDDCGFNFGDDSTGEIGGQNAGVDRFKDYGGANVGHVGGYGIGDNAELDAVGNADLDAMLDVQGSTQNNVADNTGYNNFCHTGEGTTMTNTETYHGNDIVNNDSSNTNDNNYRETGYDSSYNTSNGTENKAESNSENRIVEDPKTSGWDDGYSNGYYIGYEYGYGDAKNGKDNAQYTG